MSLSHRHDEAAVAYHLGGSSAMTEDAERRMAIDPDAFNAYEQAAWDTVADAYIAGFGHLTKQSIDALLDAVSLKAGMRYLDVATGPGWAAEAAAQRGARAIGIDVSAAMLAEARQRHPGLSLQLASAEALPFRDGTFDAVGSNYGMLHFGRPDEAIREAYRVLRAGGRFAFTVWAAPTETVAYEIVLGALQTHGQLDVGLPPGPAFFRFSDPAEAAASLTAAGFVDPVVATVQQVWRLPSAEALFDVMRLGTGRTRGLILGQTSEAQAAIRGAIVQRARAYEVEGGLLLPMPAVVSTARRPK